MFWWSRERTIDWLESQGATPLSEDRWAWSGSPDVMTNNELAHELTETALGDPALSSDDRLMLGFGLLDLLDDYAVAMYLAWEFVGVEAAHSSELELVWRYCREVLERPAEPKAVPYWLWVDWFETPGTTLPAFDNVSTGWDDVNASEETVRRLDRVLRVSGPVPWDAKVAAYRDALGRPELRSALLAGLRGSRHDVYGSINSTDALMMTKRLASEHGLGAEARNLARAIRDNS